MLIFVFCIYLITFVIVTTQGKRWFSREVENEVKVGRVERLPIESPVKEASHESKLVFRSNGCSILGPGIAKKVKGLGHTY